MNSLKEINKQQAELRALQDVACIFACAKRAAHFGYHEYAKELFDEAIEKAAAMGNAEGVKHITDTRSKFFPNETFAASVASLACG